MAREKAELRPARVRKTKTVSHPCGAFFLSGHFISRAAARRLGARPCGRTILARIFLKMEGTGDGEDACAARARAGGGSVWGLPDLRAVGAAVPARTGARLALPRVWKRESCSEAAGKRTGRGARDGWEARGACEERFAGFLSRRDACATGRSGKCFWDERKGAWLC